MKNKKNYIYMLFGFILFVLLIIMYFKVFNSPVVDKKLSYTSNEDGGYFVLVSNEANMYFVLSPQHDDYGQAKYENDIYNLYYGYYPRTYRNWDVCILSQYQDKENNDTYGIIASLYQVCNFNNKVVFKIKNNYANLPFLDKNYISFDIVEFDNDDELRKYVSEIKYEKTSEDVTEHGVFPTEITEDYEQ